LTAWTEQGVLARALLARAARRIRIGWCQGTDAPFIELVANFGCGLGSLLVGLSAQSQHLDTEPTAPPATASPSSPRYDRTAAAILDAAAHAFAEHGAGANMAEVAAAAGVGRATLYRYYPSRETLLQALAAKAIADAAGRIADAGLDRCPVPEAIERIVRALLAVGDRYVVLLGEQVEPDPDESERLVGTPLRAVFARGIEQGVLRDDLPPEDLQHLFGGLLVAAIKLVGERRLGLEETAAATTALFLDGARTPERTPGGG
jgi:AcrR family transcriptional regulator